ncbi:MAG TPA: hypothetical protein VL961_06725 [Acidimicrobiales bacterium]|nr:hypothetical protein [Acidimicrobiales bacterium]
MLRSLGRLHEHLRVREAYLWLVPVGVAMVFLMVSEKTALEIMGACIALLVFVFMINRPGGTLVALIIFLPLEPMGFPLLYRLHIPGTFLHQFSSIKELMALAILVAGLRAIRDTGRHLDKVDVFLLLYVAAVTLYLIVPHFFSALAPTQLAPRLLAWRTDAGYPLVFFGARHAVFSTHLRQRVIRVILVMGAFMGLVGLYQKVSGTGFANFVDNTARVPQYLTNVLGDSPSFADSSVKYAISSGVSFHHITSILLSPYDFADYMIIVALVAAVHISYRHRSVFTYAVFAIAAACIWFTQVRGDAVAVGIALVLVAIPASRTPLEGRIRLVALLVLAAVLVVPALGGSRFSGSNKGAQLSSQGHIYEIEDGLGVIYYEPLGLGLGNQPGVGLKYNTSSALINGGDISDNMITQVGDELGLQSMIPWLIMMFLVGLALQRRASKGDELAAGIGFAFVGWIIAGQTHHVFLTFPGPWTLWVVMGLAVNLTPAETAGPPHPGEEWNQVPLAADVR